MMIKATQPKFSMKYVPSSYARAQYPEDRYFQTLLAILLVMFVVMGLVFPFLTLPKLAALPIATPAMPMIQAVVVLKKMEVVKNPEPVVVLPEKLPVMAEVKMTEEKTVEETNVIQPVKTIEKKPVAKNQFREPAEPRKIQQNPSAGDVQPQVVTQQAVAQARAQASKSGLMVMRGQLQQLQQVAQASNQASVPIGAKRAQAASSYSLSVSDDMDAMGQQALSQQDVQLDTVSTPVATQLSVTHQTRQVASIGAGENQANGYRAATGAAVAKSTAVKKAGVRSEASIRQVFEQNKSAIFALYHRALRTNPNLQGKMVFKITINADGQMTACELLSSQLGDPELEKKLLTKIRQLNFGMQNVAPLTMTYALDFVPS
jgi:hypothetical protein